MAGECCAKDENGDRTTRTFAEAHAEIEQRGKAKLLEQDPVTPFGRPMTCKSMIESIGSKLHQRRDRGSANEAVEQNRDLQMARSKRGTEDGRKLASAKRGSDSQGIAKDGAVLSERDVDHLPFSPEAIIADPGAVTSKALGPTAEQSRGGGRRRGGIADPHVP